MIRPNFIGPKALYFNPSIAAATELTTTDLAAIDGAIDFATVNPYAYSATVRDDYDTMNINFSNAGSSLALGQRVAVGLFISPSNDLKNLLFQVSGKASILFSGTSIVPMCRFFFGRKASNNTVTSSKAAPANTLAAYQVLPSITSSAVKSTSELFFNDSINHEIFSLESSGAYNYCFGVMIDNHSASNAVGLYGSINLSIRKYQSELGVFRPSR